MTSFDETHTLIDLLDSSIIYTSHQPQSPTIDFRNSTFRGTVTYQPDKDIFLFNCHLINPARIKYWASCPLLRIYSYSGSGLPYPNPTTAYDNTPNQGTIETDTKGDFVLRLLHPSSYYINQGKTLLNPHVHLQINNRTYTIVIADFFPYRSLTNLPDSPDRSNHR